MARKPTYEELEQKVKEFESSGYRNKKEGEALKESEFQFDYSSHKLVLYNMLREYSSWGY